MVPTSRIVALLLTLLGVARVCPAGPTRGGEPERAAYSFGVVPQFEQRKLNAVWEPIMAEVSRRTGLRLELVTTLAIDDFEREFVGERFDFVYMNPYHVLKATSYVPLVADHAPLRGILVVRRDDPIDALASLEGKVIAFPSPNALGASLLMRAELVRLHHLKFTPLYVNTHSSVYLHVAKGLVAAGGGVEKTLAEQPAAVRDGLRVLHTTRSVPSHPVAAHARVPEADRLKMREALLAMDATPEGRALLAAIPTRKVISVDGAAYEPMRAWGLDAFWVDFWTESPRR